jgi:peptide chain release factor 1
MDKKINKLIEYQKMLENSEDKEFSKLILEEIDILKEQLVQDRQEDSNNAILEVRSGTGGEEAELFAGELVRMYLKFCEKREWRVRIQNQNINSIGGIKEFVSIVEGENAYGTLKYEGGIHRVQRVPKTEKGGRIHTSAATVAVLPEIKEEIIEIRSEDLKIDVYRSGGHGGQSVNTTDSAVRITHLPTGIVVTCQDERSQLKNKEKATSILRSKLWQRQQEEKQKEMGVKRLSMVGSGDRSEKIRTYNYPQDRITDHRIPRSWNNMSKILDGNLDIVTKELKNIERDKELEEILKNASRKDSE